MHLITGSPTLLFVMAVIIIWYFPWTTLSQTHPDGRYCSNPKCCLYGRKLWGRKAFATLVFLFILNLIVYFNPALITR